MNQFLERKQNISTSILIDIENRVGSRNRYKFEENFGTASSVNWNWRVTRSDWIWGSQGDTMQLFWSIWYGNHGTDATSCFLGG
jgi:hypothetical protein